MSGQNKIEIYTTPTCRFCHAVKDFFKKHKIKYTEYNVLEKKDKAMEMIERSGQQGVPVIVIDGDWDDFVLGFDEEKLRMKLKIKS